MKTKYWTYLIITVLGLLVVYMMYETFSQPGVADLEGHYQEISHARNENNTGPVVRVYAVYTSDQNWEEMKAYGDYMPHTKYGNTKVFFFDQDMEQLDLNLSLPFFDKKYQSSCLGVYEKSAMGEVSFKKNPFD
ncbi:MAG: hypothetical protein WD398_12495 [Cyclobacteriaceae bacterium]